MQRIWKQREKQIEKVLENTIGMWLYKGIAGNSIGNVKALELPYNDLDEEENNMSFNRGSEWNKWDLHVHTPKSIEQHYGGDTSDAWENFIDDIENLPENIKVLGINDYIFLDGYKEILKYKSQGRMPNINLFLPVIELRVDKYGNLDDKAWKRVNLHIIFSDAISAETIESQFLNAIQVNYRLSPIDEFNQDCISFSGVITKDSLSDLGKRLKKVPLYL